MNRIGLLTNVIDFYKFYISLDIQLDCRKYVRDLFYAYDGHLQAAVWLTYLLFVDICANEDKFNIFADYRDSLIIYIAELTLKHNKIRGQITLSVQHSIHYIEYIICFSLGI